MERLTNDPQQFIQQIKLELLTFEQEGNWESIFTYSELPYFLTYGFSYNWSFNTVSAKYRLRRKEWNSEYDHARFSEGIYNLDRLAILEKKVPLASKDKFAINSVDLNLLDLVEFEGIVLDGLMCELHLNSNDKTLEWNIDAEMNPELLNLIYTIRNWQREIKLS